VIHGLTAADQIIVNPSDSLVTGTPVRVGGANAGESK
jgi:hypothetical protein